MNVVAMFILGLFIGWLAEWVIDWFYNPAPPKLPLLAWHSG